MIEYNVEGVKLKVEKDLTGRPYLIVGNFRPIPLKEDGTPDEDVLSREVKDPELAEKVRDFLRKASSVGDTFTYTGDRPFKGRIQVAALSMPESRFTRLQIKCSGEHKDPSCPLIGGLTLSMDGRFDPSAFATYFDTNEMKKALHVLLEKRGVRCSEWRRNASIRGS